MWDKRKKIASNHPTRKMPIVFLIIKDVLSVRKTFDVAAKTIATIVSIR